jgi:hypothetical protein
MVKLSKTPIDETQLTAFVVDHDVVRFDVAVHDAARVAEVEGFKELVDVVALAVEDRGCDVVGGVERECGREEGREGGDGVRQVEREVEIDRRDERRREWIVNERKMGGRRKTRQVSKWIRVKGGKGTRTTS